MPATPAEEIARQQAEAEDLLDRESCPCFEYPVGGPEVSLSDKECPVFQQPTPPAAGCCVSSRARVDVSLLRNLVSEGYNRDYRTEKEKGKEASTSVVKKASQNSRSKSTYKSTSVKRKQSSSTASRRSSSKTNYWDPDVAAKSNVSIHRPSHDAWGIGKIVLLFCDDFVSKIYELPWYRRFREALTPVLAPLGLTPESPRLVRVLLASLPPGTTIPVHYDTGAWVSRTHRVHVPVLAQDGGKRILFRCGPTPDELLRVDCAPGHIFEMNNQAYHAVSNASTDHRVHLILDYLDEDAPPRVVLDPGERLIQTRRSIDRLRDKGSRPTPTFFILGAQKAGTTSLYDVLTQHPLIVPARRRETHCFDWRWQDCEGDVKKQRQHCLSFYLHKDLQLCPSCLTGDSTPSYLLDSRRVIPRMKKIFTHPLRFFVMVRDPVRRAASHFAMVTSPHGTPAQLKTRGSEWRTKTMHEVVDEELRQLSDAGVIPYWNFDTNSADEKAFAEFSDTPEESEAWNRYLDRHVPLNTGSYGLLARGMYALQLKEWFRAYDDDDPSQQFLVLQLERFDPVRDAPRIYAHVGAAAALTGTAPLDASPKNTREYEYDEKDHELLRRFFRLHNLRLSKMLQKTYGKDEWQNLWGCEDGNDDNSGSS